MRPLPWLAPLTPLYAAAARAKNRAYDSGLLKPRVLRAPVVSVGNLSTGGSGKTPFVIALSRLLVSAGIPVDVLSRGYGRASNAAVQVDPSAASTAAQFGDEPLMIARSAAVPVYAGGSRYAAGLLAEQDAARLHLLDDGFQHRQLSRSLDIVLIHPLDLAQALLPSGYLREPLSSLRRADVVVLREEDASLAGRLSRYLAPGASIWHVRRRLFAVAHPGPAVAFCGIAHPSEFFLGLRQQHVELATSVAYPDHHAFTAADLSRLCGHAMRTRASRFITTEKDYVRLAPAAVAQLESCAPVAIATLDVTIVEADAALNRIRSL